MSLASAAIITHPDILLMQFARAEIGRPFMWGETNCVALALRALDVQCGSALMRCYRKHMASEQRALVWVARNGLAGLIERFIREGCREIAPNFIQAGDVAFSELPGSIGAAVYLGRNFLSSSPEAGVRQFRPVELMPPSVVIGVR